MLDYIYPEEEQRFFTDREHPLALLALSRDLLTQGVRKHLAFSGFRRVGKTVILKEFLRRHLAEKTNRPVVVAYLDLPRLALTPEAFAVQYIGHLLYWLEERQEQRVEPYFDPAVQLTAVGRYGSQALSDHLRTFYQELQKERPDQHRLLEMAFNWPEVWAQALGRPVVLLLDEFPEILALNNYPQIHNVVALFRAVLQAQSRVCYVVAGSMIRLVDALAEDGERWAVEIKWRGKLAGLKEVHRLARAAQTLSARPWFISRAGFTPEAEAYARQEGIMRSTRDDIEALARIARELPPGTPTAPDSKSV